MYQANYYIKNYLVGKGLTYSTSDYRYYYFTEGAQLTEALAIMPFWYKNNFAEAWDG